MTRAPACASTAAKWAPSPLEAPVTSAVLFARSFNSKYSRFKMGFPWIVEQSCGILKLLLMPVENSLGRIVTALRRRDIDIWPDPEPVSASDRVSFGIIQALEQQRMVAGQRLIEPALASQFGVGRNAVREAIQRLAARGIVDLSRNRSPAIRMLSVEEAMEVLEVAEAMTGLLARGAARKFDHTVPRGELNAVVDGRAKCA